VRITVIAAGFDEEKPVRRPREFTAPAPASAPSPAPLPKLPAPPAAPAKPAEPEEDEGLDVPDFLK
jgi:hypothetical protein